MKAEKFDFFLYFTVDEQVDRNTKVTIKYLDEPPQEYASLRSFRFKSNTCIVDVYIHQYFKQQMHVPLEHLMEASVEFVKRFINKDENLLQRITNGRRLTVIDVYRGKSRIKTDL